MLSKISREQRAANQLRFVLADPRGARTFAVNSGERGLRRGGLALKTQPVRG